MNRRRGRRARNAYPGRGKTFGKSPSPFRGWGAHKTPCTGPPRPSRDSPAVGHPPASPTRQCRRGCRQSTTYGTYPRRASWTRQVSRSQAQAHPCTLLREPCCVEVAKAAVNRGKTQNKTERGRTGGSVRGKNERHCSSHRGPRARPQMFSLGLAPISQVCTPNPTRRHEKRDAIFF